MQVACSLSVVKVTCEMGGLRAFLGGGTDLPLLTNKRRRGFLWHVLAVCVEKKALATGKGSFHLYPHQLPWVSPGHAATSATGLVLGHSAKLARFFWFSKGAKRGESFW